MRIDQPEDFKRIFKILNKVMLLHWRLGLGRLLNIHPPTIGRIMVLVHTGRKSGLRRYTPVNYAIGNDDIYCLAGFGSKAD